MNQYQISAADVARATQSTAANIQARMDVAKPTTATEIAYDKKAMDELAARQVQNQTQIAANQKAYEEQQRLNNLKYAEQQRLNQLASQQQIATNQKAYEAYLANQAKLAAEQATKTTGFQTSAGTMPFANATQGFAQNFQNYQSIAPGAQYNPAVMAGGASPYSLIMGQMKPMGNPYAGVVAGQAMGGYNPGLYDQIAEANTAKTAAETALAAATQTGIDQSSTGGMAQGGMVNGGLMFGMNPPGPDDGAVNLDMGEYVIKKSSVNKYGRGLLDMINEGKVPAKKMKSLLG